MKCLFWHNGSLQDPEVVWKEVLHIPVLAETFAAAAELQAWAVKTSPQLLQLRRAFCSEAPEMFCRNYETPSDFPSARRERGGGDDDWTLKCFIILFSATFNSSKMSYLTVVTVLWALCDEVWSSRNTIALSLSSFCTLIVYNVGSPSAPSV